MTRRVIRDRRIVTDDCEHLADDAALPGSGCFTLSLERWRREREVLGTRLADAGVRLPNDLDVNDVFAEIAESPRIVLNFPRFGDGRALSQARVLREQHGYTGEIRASGDVQRDLLWQMYRCGIDVFEVRPDRSIEDALKAFSEMSVTYQAAVDTPQSIFLRRRLGA